jgi:hypothetical protein
VSNHRHDHHFQHRSNRADIRETVSALFPRIKDAAEHDGDCAVFTIERPDDDHDEERSFSVDALHALHEEVMVFVVSRIVREWEANGHAPKRLAVEVRARVT